MKRNLIIVMAALLLSSTLMTSCGPEKPDTSKEGLYVGIIGFNSELNTKTLKLLNEDTKDNMKSFISSLTMSNGTILYHAVNTALDKIEAITPPEDLVNVSIITFTDGLDQGSYVLNDNYNSGAEYLTGVSNRIRNGFIGDVPIDSYSIGVKGSDVTDDATFLNTLQKLSSDPRHKVFLVDNMEQVATTFAEIAQNLYSQSTFWQVTLKTPAPDPGTRMRFTFDQVTDANDSERYIEGVFSYDDGVANFNNITYVGLEDCGDIIYPTTEGIFMLFSFSNLFTNAGDQVTTDFTKHWTWNAANNSWVKNSEFTPNGNTVTHEEFRSALVMLVLDCSSSLGTDFQNVKIAANQFIETLNGNTHQ